MLSLIVAYRSFGRFRQASTHLDTPPFSIRHHPGSAIAPCAEDPPFVAGTRRAVARLFPQSPSPIFPPSGNRLFLLSLIRLRSQTCLRLSGGSGTRRRQVVRPAEACAGRLGRQDPRPPLLADPGVLVGPGTQEAVPAPGAGRAFAGPPASSARTGAVLVDARVGDDALEAAAFGPGSGVPIQLGAAVPTEHRVEIAPDAEAVTSTTPRR